MIATAFELSTTEFDLVWHDLGLGRVPYPLAVPRVGATLGQRAHLTERVRHLLRYDGSGLAGLLEILARGGLSVDAVGHAGGPFRALAAGSGETGVLAVVGPDTVRLAEIRSGQLAESIVDLLPPAPPGPGPVLTVPVGWLAAPASEPDPVDVWTSDARRPGEAELAALVAARVAGGQFGVTVVTRTGTRRRADTLVSWFDARGGRYLLIRAGGWLSLAPADNRRIAHRLAEVVRAVSGR
jgi:hypothetical protein